MWYKGGNRLTNVSSVETPPDIFHLTHGRKTNVIISRYLVNELEALSHHWALSWTSLTENVLAQLQSDWLLCLKSFQPLIRGADALNKNRLETEPLLQIDSQQKPFSLLLLLLHSLLPHLVFILFPEHFCNLARACVSSGGGVRAASLTEHWWTRDGMSSSGFLCVCVFVCPAAEPSVIEHPVGGGTDLQCTLRVLCSCSRVLWADRNQKTTRMEVTQILMPF